MDEDLKNAAEILGKAFRPEQIIELEQELTRAQAGEGKYAIKIDEDKNDVMDITGLTKPEIEKYFPEAKKIVMQKAFEFKSKNRREPNQFERKKHVDRGVHTEKSGTGLWILWNEYAGSQ